MSVYNGSATVATALASVAAQTRPPDQIVVVDDGSTDETVAIVEQWSSVLPIELVVHDRNRGLATGRTTGTNRLGTDLVLAIDADDAWLPHHLDVMERAHARQPGIVAPTAVRWSPDRDDAVGWTERLQPRPRGSDLEQLVVMNWLFSGSMYERAAYLEVGGIHRFAGCDDWDLWIRLVAAGASVTTTAEPTVLYRVHASSMSANDRLLMREIEVLEAVVAEHSEPHLIAAALRGLRHRHARVALLEAYDEARSGRALTARRCALRAVRGPSGVVVRAAAMVVAPRWTTSRRGGGRSPVAS